MSVERVWTLHKELKDSKRVTVTIKDDSILTGIPPSLCTWRRVFQTPRRKQGEIWACQRFLSECLFILSVTVGPNLISVGCVCSAVRLFSYRHALWRACEVPKADMLVVSSAPYSEITPMNCVFHHFSYSSVTKPRSSDETQRPDGPWHV